MRIAVLGDIHGNLPALEAALAAADAAKCGLIVHTGDLIGYGPYPNETIDLVRARGIEGVRGHFDESAAWRFESSGAGGGEAAIALADLAHAWNLRVLGQRQVSWLKDLPFSLERRIEGKLVSVFHASPSDLVTGIDPSASGSTLRQYVEETGADVFLFGHTHRGWHRALGGAHFVNAGSVGCSTDGDARSAITIVDVGASRVEVDLRRVPYDVERVARDVAALGLPREIADQLRGGRIPLPDAAASRGAGERIAL